MPDTHEEISHVDKLRSVVDYISRAGAMTMTDALRKKLYKLSVRQCAVLANIRRFTHSHSEGIPMSVLAERVGMSPSAASHMVDSLMSQGMVERHQGATDRRAVLVTISQSFLKDKALTLQLEAVDLLRQKTSESSNVGTGTRQFGRTETFHSYVMLHAIYKFKL